MTRSLRVLALSTVAAGLDILQQLRGHGHTIAGIVGLNPDSPARGNASGWVDVAQHAPQLAETSLYVSSYNLKEPDDRASIEEFAPDLILVIGWQRLVPEWLLKLAPLGAIGVHGSPDGITGGRGRSPQNWALLLGCRDFDISLFRLSAGIDDGPILAHRTFCLGDEDDIVISYYRSALATAEMIHEVLLNPSLLNDGRSQEHSAFYFPQRRPEDGWVDWSLPASTIARHCRALTRPYPGLHAKSKSSSIRIWQCQPFDSIRHGMFGRITACFVDGAFVISCGDGHLLVREWSSAEGWFPTPGEILTSSLWSEQLGHIIARHEAVHPEQPISQRLVTELRIASNLEIS